jgi:hypothetical protein
VELGATRAHLGIRTRTRFRIATSLEGADRQPTTCCLVRLHCDDRPAPQIGIENLEDTLNRSYNLGASQALQSQTDHRRPACPGDGHDCMKISVQGHYDSSSRFPRRAGIHVRLRVGRWLHLAELPDRGSGAWLSRSGGGASCRAVLKIGGGERKSLPNVVQLQFGIAGKGRRGSDISRQLPRPGAPSDSSRGYRAGHSFGSDSR